MSSKSQSRAQKSNASRRNQNKTSAQHTGSTSSVVSLPPIKNKSSSSSKLPTCIDDVHTQIGIAIRAANQELKLFRTGYKMTGMNFDSLGSVAVELSAKERINNSKDAKSFSEWLEVMEREALMNKDSDFLSLKGFCDKVDFFTDKLLGIFPQILTAVKDYAGKFLNSLCPNPEEHNVSLANDLDEISDSYKQECKKQLKQVDKILGDIQSMLSSFVDSGIPDAAQFNKEMDEAEACLTKVCHILKQWVGSDKYYISELSEEMRPWNEEREKLNKQIKIKDRKKRAIVKKITAAHAERDGLKLALHQKKHEKNKLADREKQLNQIKETSDESQQDKWDRQLQRFAKEKEDIEDNESMIKDEINIQENIIDDLEKEFRKADMRVLKATTKLEESTAYMESLKALHRLKTNPATLRNIYFDRGSQSNKDKDDMSLACRLVANDIGDEWLKLYFVLPFKPPRDKVKRQKDIGDVRNTCLHKDVLPVEYPWYSLLKWRTFQRKADVKQLCKALRKIELENLALKVESEF